MLPSNRPAIKLKVYAREILGVTDLAGFAEEIEQRFSEKLGTVAVVLDTGRAIAINLTNIPGVVGPDPATLRDLERAHDLARYVIEVGRLDLEYALLWLAVPATKYRVLFHFPRKELRHQVQTKERESWDDVQDIEVVCEYKSPVETRTLESLRSLV